jgi:hypothetical protein
VARYAQRAKSALYPGAGQERPLATWEAFRVAASHRPTAGAAWLERLRQVSQEAVQAVVSAVPATHMTQTAKDFACTLLAYNAKLLGV